MCLSGPDLNPIKYLWRDLKIAVQRHSPSNLTELEWNCREEWEKLPKYRSCQACSVILKKTRGYNRCQRCFNKVLSKGSEYLCKCVISRGVCTNTFLLLLCQNWFNCCFSLNQHELDQITELKISMFILS